MILYKTPYVHNFEKKNYKSFYKCEGVIYNAALVTQS